MSSSSDSLLVVGSIAFDDLDLPSGEYRSVVGGSATYASVAASLLLRQASVRTVGVVGSDFPSAFLDDLKARGIDVSGVQRADGKTFRWHGRYSKDLASRTTLDTQLNVFAEFAPRIAPDHRSSAFVLLGNIHPKLQIDVLEQVPRCKFVAADTMNFWIEREPSELARMLGRIDLLVINDEEARALSGIDNLVRAAADIRKRGPKALVVKRGEFGSLLFDDQGAFFAPGYPLEEIRDPTGAGDSFAGGLMGFVASNREASPAVLRKAMFYASSLGSFCVEGVGASRLLAIGRSELLARIAAFGRLVDYGGDLQPPS